MIRNIEIENYITKVVLSQKRKPLYYIYNSKLKRFSKEIPDKIKDRIEIKPMKIGLSTKFIAFIDGKPLLQNPRAAGTPKIVTINGQNIYNGTMHPMQRFKIVNSIKEFFISQLIGQEPIKSKPVEISFVFYNTINQDIDNHAWIYIKCFLDALVSMKILEDDTVEFIRKVSYEYVESENRKLTVQINESEST